MFSNIGRKIKTLAKVLCWLGIIASLLSGIIMVVIGVTVSRPSPFQGYVDPIGFYLGGTPGIVGGIVIMVVGSLTSWSSSFCMYGFGQLIENSDTRTRVALQQSKKELP